MSEQQKIIERLEKIIELLTPKPTPVSTPKGIRNEFKEFLKTYKVLGFTIAFIMGLYLGNLAQSLVKNLLLPLIGLAIPELQDLARARASNHLTSASVFTWTYGHLTRIKS